MASVFLVGPPRCGKSTLLKEYQEEFGSIQVIDEVWRDCGNSSSFRATAKRQIQQEKRLKKHLFISKGCVIDILVEAIQKRRLRLPNNLPEDNGAKQLLSQVFHNDENNVSEVLLRYRQSLNVLIQPFVAQATGANMEVDPYLTRYQQVFQLLRIPFVELKETEIEARVRFVRKAVKECIFPSPLASLKYYETLSANPKKGKANEKKKTKQELLKSFYESLNLPFYMVKSNHSTAAEGDKSKITSQYALKCLKISEEEVEQDIEEAQDGRTNRFLDKRGGSHDLFLLHFDIRVPSTTVFEILRSGVCIQGDLYSFLGCSSSGLKARKCYVLKGTAEPAHLERQEYGDFAALKTISKQMARFSLLLTNVVPTNVIPTNVKTENDVELQNGSNFTDGCGCISPDLANKLYQQSKDKLRRKSERAGREPSVFQIRHQGNKGIVTRNSKLPPNTIVLRPSMEKFQTNEFPNICVCDYSRPFSYGHLNRQFIMLLSGLGINDVIFEELQADHFDRIKRMTSDRDSALMILEWRHRSKEFLEAYHEEPCLVWEEGKVPIFYKDLREIQQRLIQESLKLKILIPQSRTLFGVAETPRSGRSGCILKPGECMVRVTMSGNRQVSLQGQRVVVSKNPCYLVGDVRVLRAVSSSERPGLADLEKDLVDCLVFPITGDRPHSEEIAGSDLDGDMYFVCWDERLVPSATAEPFGYPAYKPTNTKKKSSDSEELVRYFAGQNNVSSLMGRISNLFLAWADLKGVSSSECTRLGQLFSRAVDSAKSGENVKVPESLLVAGKDKPVPSRDSKYVWQRLEFAANAFIEEQLKTGALNVNTDNSQERATQATFDTYDVAEPNDEESFWLDLFSRPHLGMSEFTKFCLILKFLGGDVDTFFRSQFSMHVNFGLFSPTERGFALREQGVPASVMNNPIRCYSQIVGYRTNFLRKCLLEAEVPWEFYWRGNEQSQVGFPAMIAHALRKNTGVLMIMQLPDSVVLLLRFSRNIIDIEHRSCLLVDSENQSGCSEQELKGFLSVSAVFLSDHFGYAEKYALDDPNYKMDLSERGLQLYRGKTGTTFVYVKVLQPPSSGKKEPRAKGTPGESEVPKLQISIDLNRFNRRMLVGSRPHPLVRKSPVFGVEMFITNRRSDHASRAARISHLDVLLQDGEPWTDAGFFELADLLEDEESDEMLMPGLLENAEGIKETILDLCSSTNKLSPSPSE